MADPIRLGDADLERALRDLGRRYPYPPTPNLAATVRARIVVRPIAPVRPIALWRDPRRLALVAAVLLVLAGARSEEHTSELQSRGHLVCRLLLEKKKKQKYN